MLFSIITVCPTARPQELEAVDANILAAQQENEARIDRFLPEFVGNDRSSGFPVASMRS